MNRNISRKHRRRLRRHPDGAAAPLGLCFLDMFLIILYHRYLWIFLIYSLYIPYIFPSYVKYVFPCVFLNLWSQEKTSPYRKTTFIFFSPDFTPFIFSLTFLKNDNFPNKIVPFGPQPGPRKIVFMF